MKLSTLTLLFLMGCCHLWAQPTFTANDQVPTYDTPYRQGVNPGYHGQSWSDSDLANMAAGNPQLGLLGAGCKALRVSLPEEFLLSYGYDVRIDEFNHYASLGMDEHTVFLETPAYWHQDTTFYCEDEQSTMFARMYLPIWDNGENGTPINDDNYAARYVYNTVNMYGDYVRFWELWNEPDFDFSGNAWKDPGQEGNWFENVPDPCDYKLHAPVYHYIRLLRITYEVIKTLDPDAFVAVGGIGYEGFLDIILRHTDNPDGGQVTNEFPLTGGAYFDCLSYHCYPHLDGGMRYWSNDAGGFVYTRHSDAAAAEVIHHKNEMESLLAEYGYDNVTYPKKVVINTESNIPRKSFGTKFGSNEAQRNFAIKVQVEAYRNELRQLHFYNLADKESYEEAESWSRITGLYSKILDSEPYDITINDAGIACRTTTLFLWEKTYDEAETAALELPEKVHGAAFKNVLGNHVYVLWAETEIDSSEVASATYSFPVDFNFASVDVKYWDFGETNIVDNMPPTDIPLTGAPIFLAANPLPPDNTIEATIVQNFQVSPNPASDVANVSFGLAKDGKVEIELFDAAGKKMTYTTDNQSLTNFHNTEINIKNFPKGVYFGRVLIDNQAVKSFRLVKE